MCLNHCLSLGAAFMATQFGFECWCSSEVDLDYERHFDLIGVDAVCDMSCQGNTVRTFSTMAVSSASALSGGVPK